MVFSSCRFLAELLLSLLAAALRQQRGRTEQITKASAKLSHELNGAGTPEKRCSRNAPFSPAVMVFSSCRFLAELLLSLLAAALSQHHSDSTHITVINMKLTNELNSARAAEIRCSCNAPC
jgi:hypothetical protein